MKNAFNSVISDQPSNTRYRSMPKSRLSMHDYCSLRPTQRVYLQIFGQHKIRSACGVQQVYLLGSLFFALAVRPLSQIRDADQHVVFGWRDNRVSNWRDRVELIRFCGQRQRLAWTLIWRNARWSLLQSSVATQSVMFQRLQASKPRSLWYDGRVCRTYSFALRNAPKLTVDGAATVRAD